MTKRSYTGMRSGNQGMVSEAVRLKKLEIMKGGKLPLTNADRYKRILQKKLEEHRKVTSLANKRPMSKKAEQALEEMAKKKAAKEEKALRQMIVIQPRVFPSAGRIDAKGRVYDLADNMVLRVDAKTGKVKTMGGMTLGKYKPSSMFSNMRLTDWLMARSPYFLNLKKQQMLQYEREMYLTNLALAQGGVYGTAGELMAVNLHGQGHHNPYGHALDGRDHHHDDHSYALEAQKAANVTALGVMSNNVHGTFGENVWGGMADNVWGTASSNVWGGIGGSAWSTRGMKIWGSGQPGQKNYLRPILTFFSTMLGFKGKRRHRHRHGGHSGRHSAGRTAGRTGR